MASHQQEPWLLENGNVKVLTKEMRHGHGRSRTAHNMSSSSLRKKSDRTLVSKVRCGLLRNLLVNIQEVILGTKLSILFPAIPIAIIAQCYGLGRPWIFALSLLGLTPLAERVSFLTEQVAIYTGPTVGGLLNATCGNITELVIAIFALSSNKVDLVKYSLLGSILSNLLLVLGTSLLCGGIANLAKEQKYDRELRQGRPIGRGEGWTMSHRKKNGSYMNEDARLVGEAIEHIESQDPSSKEFSHNDSLAQVLGKEHPGRVRGLGFGPCPSQCFRNIPQQSNYGVQIEEYQMEIAKLKAEAAKLKAESAELKAAAEEKAKRQRMEAEGRQKCRVWEIC
ncbi:vacuolar cation/proton exchanger 3 [Arachis duranensis]|uniref:Vacuolar cation/proton exchanger 3 n=1 Tax=Arachis duranensis TaxID=130453 RepID=A0A9C6WDA2_ARADU|nr:vacuolar cation/proton exchanger 3 [Arachis duranensis]